MRRILTGFVVALVAGAIPAWALAGNQEVAQQIAHNLRDSGQMSDYKVGVKYQDGTVWLRGQVSNPEQMKTALRLVSQTPGVTRVVNELSMPAAPSSFPRREPSASEPTASPSVAATKAPETEGVPATAARVNPLRSSPNRGTAETARQPSLVKRLESIISGGSEQPAMPSAPEPGEKPAQANRVPNSFAMSRVEPASAEEASEAPQPIEAPRHAKLMARTANNATRVAMVQPVSRGPEAPTGGPLPMYTAAARAGVAPARYDQPCLPNYAWPSYAAYPNYAAVTYPKQYSPTAWPYIGPFYPYPQVPLGWRKVTLEWDSGWWFLDFKDQPAGLWHK